MLVPYNPFPVISKFFVLCAILLKTFENSKAEDGFGGDTMVGIDGVVMVVVEESLACP